MGVFSCPPFLNREGGWGVRFLLLLACLLVRLARAGRRPAAVALVEHRPLHRRRLLHARRAPPGSFRHSRTRRLPRPPAVAAPEPVAAGRLRALRAGADPSAPLSVLFGLLTVAVFWLGLRRAWGARAADYGALFLGLAPPFALVQPARVAGDADGLLAGPGLHALGLWRAAARSLRAGWPVRRRGRVCSRGWPDSGAGAAGGGTHPAASGFPSRNGWGRSFGEDGASDLLVLPFREDPQRLAGRWVLSGLLLGLALYAALWYLPHHAETSRMATFYRVHQMQPHSWHNLGLNVRRAFLGGERGVFPYLLALLPVPCALAGWGLWKRKQEWDGAGRFFALWLAGGLLFCLLSSYAPSRYYVLFLPALAGLAARGLMQTRRPVQVLAVAVFLLTSAAWYGAAWAGRSYARRDAGRELTRLLPPGSVVIGEFAPALCLDTPFAAAPVQPGLSNDDRPVERLKATHMAVTRAALSGRSGGGLRYPDMSSSPRTASPRSTSGARGTTCVDVYAVKEVPKEVHENRPALSAVRYDDRRRASCTSPRRPSSSPSSRTGCPRTGPWSPSAASSRSGRRRPAGRPCPPGGGVGAGRAVHRRVPGQRQHGGQQDIHRQPAGYCGGACPSRSFLIAWAWWFTRPDTQSK